MNSAACYTIQAMPNHSPFRVALTGGIACGKTTATEMFAALSVPVIDADVVSRELTAAGQPGLIQLVAQFGSGILRADGDLDRPALRQRLFSDSKVRKRVNDILHPLILDEMQRQVSQHSGAEYIILAIPLLVETDSKHLADRVLVVDCEEQQQLARLQQRDSANPAQARLILDSQASRQDRLAQADDVLTNNGNLESLRQQVGELHNRYQSLAKQADFKHNKRP